MNSRSTRVLAALLTLSSVVLGAAAPVAATQNGVAAVTEPLEVPILFNDRHVYAKPTRLRRNRVLTALVRGDTILVPLRSVFEAMGANVAFNRTTQTVKVSKPGADVSITVGKSEVNVNGERRPLDVPAELYRGNVLVPLRVLSEGMGAYVAWVANKRIVVVRYAAPATPVSPPPSVAPSPPPTPQASAQPQTPAPSAPPAASRYERFIVGDYVFDPKVYNELTPGSGGKASVNANATVEFPLLHLPWMLEGGFRSYRYAHDANGSGTCSSGDSSCVSGIGAQGASYVPAFTARDTDFDGRVGLKIANPRIYVGVGYTFRNTNYEGGNAPSQQHGPSVGIEKLRDVGQPFSLYGSMFYFPNVTTNAQQDLGDGTFGAVQYRILKYNVGGTLNLGNSPIFLDFGYVGDRLSNKQNAPIDQTHNGPYAGLGIHF